jgi:hypothetical protein
MVNANAPLPTAQLRLNVPITSPVGTLTLVSAGSVQVIGANPQRRGVIFVNCHSSATIYVTPANQTPSSGNGIPVLSQSQLPFYADPNTNVAFNCAWNACSDGTSSVPVEVLELL